MFYKLHILIAWSQQIRSSLSQIFTRYYESIFLLGFNIRVISLWLYAELVSQDLMLLIRYFLVDSMLIIYRNRVVIVLVF